ncbi:MAG: diguanylate cyclase [Pseudomonadota bacterium]
MYDRIIRIKRTKLYIIETVLGLMILIGINLAFMPDRPAFEGLNPSPYWIIVLGIAGRYGRNGGLFASISTSIVFLSYQFLFNGTDILYDNPWVLIHPFLFLQVGFLIGEIKTVYILREDYLTTRVEELENQNDNLTRENEIVKEAHKDLTVNVATTHDTITILNEISKKLKSFNPDDIYKGILDGFSNYLSAEESSFYALEGNLLYLKHSKGWKDYYRRPTSFEVGQGLIGLSAETKKTLNIKDFVLNKETYDVNQSTFLGDSVLAIPVLGIENKVYGVASIEKIPLLKMTDSTIQAARITCELAASSLNNAFTFMKMKEKQIKDELYDVYKYHFFLTRLDEEFTRSINYMLPLSIMAFKWTKMNELKGEEHEAVIKSIVSLIKTNLRSFDVLARTPKDEVPLVLLLATTPGPQAQGLKEKITKKINEYEFKRALTDEKLEDTIVVSDYNPNRIKSTQDMLKEVGL